MREYEIAILVLVFQDVKDSGAMIFKSYRLRHLIL